MNKWLNSESRTTMLGPPQRALTCDEFWSKAELSLSTVLGRVGNPESGLARASDSDHTHHSLPNLKPHLQP